MQWPSRALVIYLSGVALLGLFYAPLKAAAPNGWIFLGGGFVYLLLLRGIGKFFDR